MTSPIIRSERKTQNRVTALFTDTSRPVQLITNSTLKQGDIPVIAGGKQPAYFHASANRFGRTVTISGSGASAGYVALYSKPIFASDCSTISESESSALISSSSNF